MSTVQLSSHDVEVLAKINDPESNPAAGIVTDETLPRDPHVVDTSVYEAVVAAERTIIQTLQKLEAQPGQPMSSPQDEGEERQQQQQDPAVVEGYRQSASALERLVAEQPRYASARNNRAQVYRRLYGDAMLLNVTATGAPMPLVREPDRAEKLAASATVLDDLERSIALLTPSSASTPVSPQAARTLSMAHTQRAAIYLKTSKMLAYRSLDIDEARPEARWRTLDFEEAASRDLALGGRYGNQIAKGLAVSVNPTAKLCGQIVRHAMKEEYGPSSFGERIEK
ncbi:hypothetical protein GMORB2_0050 [Geosmithia morbida]|uniref:Tetratricopeptide repeat protein 36 n=1 Tax=Geosmithia morbida TaxID=1094350 RepID=A0A9P4Z462_9HYPO|nr:uncharacterized protein GMORB2_0050 [Geosmithia morbida]KAF4126314.1 hypothetical protein GMORB2_0050 [Geosmithia morbida]